MSLQASDSLSTSLIGKAHKVKRTIVGATTLLTLIILSEIEKIASYGTCDPKRQAARKTALRDSIRKEGMNRPIFVFEHNGQLVIVDGVERYEAATELGLKAGVDYEVKVLDIPNMEEAKRWRLKANVTTNKDVPVQIRCSQVLSLFAPEAKEWRKLARLNQSKGGKGQKLENHEKFDLLNFYAIKANVSRTTMGRYMIVHRELHRDPNATNEQKRPQIPAAQIESLLNDLELGNRSIKSVAEDIKNKRERQLRAAKNHRGAKQPSAGFTCASDFDPTKESQIICGDSLELFDRWAALPADHRPQPSVILGSPPYWIPSRTDKNKEDGKGRINYGEHWHAMWERREIRSFEDYVEKFLRPYIELSYRILPVGGRLLFQVDNTRGKDDKGNLIVFYHTDAIRRIARELGFIPSSEIIWQKLEISGRKQGFGSVNCPSIRPNHEYVVVLRKDVNYIEGDFDLLGSQLQHDAISSWHEKSFEEMTEQEKVLYTSAVWKIGAARSPNHAATFSIQIPTRLIQLFAPIGSLVIDPWNGTGTTCAAAVLTDRRFMGIDIEPYNCELAGKKVEAAWKEFPKLEEQARRRLLNRAA